MGHFHFYRRSLAAFPYQMVQVVYLNNMTEDDLYSTLVRETLATLKPTSIPSPPVIIAFCGIAGSGKTTLAKQLAQDLHVHYLRQDTIRFRAYEHGFKTVRAHEVTLAVLQNIMANYKNKCVLLDSSIDRTWRIFLKNCDELGMKPFVIRIVIDPDEAIARLKKRGHPDDLRLLQTLPERIADFEACLKELPADVTVTEPYDYRDTLAAVQKRLAIAAG